MTLRAPFPYFGGKRRAASLVWDALGPVDHYVEPFCGSAAVLLARPHEGRCETVNDLDGMIANFWRAVKHAPDAVAEACDWPVIECAPAGTMIATPTGDVPIERVVPGMIVWGEAGGRRVPAQVCAVKQGTAREFIRIGRLRVTGNHPVWTREGGYVEASRLTGGEHVRIFDWPATETDLRVLYSIDDESAVGSVRSERSSDGETAVRRGDVSRAATHQRAYVSGRDGTGADPSGLLAALAPAAGTAPHPVDTRDRLRGRLAGAGTALDRAASSVRGSGEPYGRGRGDAGLRSDARAPGDVVRDAEGREVSSGAGRCDVGQAPQRERAAPHRGSLDGAPPHSGGEGEDCVGSEGTGDLASHKGGISSSSSWGSVDARASSEDRGHDHEPEAGSVRRDGGLVPVNHSGGPRVGGQRGVGQSGHSQGLPLQRESLPARVAVHNFETTTGNYFADGVLVHNCDLHARHLWLIGQRESMTERLIADPEWYDAKMAGWWCWGVCAWIGDGWCDAGRPGRRLPHIDPTGRKCPEPTMDLLRAIAARLRRVDVTCGDWTRILSPSALRLNRIASTGVYFDPPYAEGAQQYAVGGTGTSLSAHVRAWCVEHERDARLRIVLSGYAGEHDELEARGWRVVAWKANGGYSNATGGANAARERLWLSPGCLDAGRAHLSVLTHLAAKYG